MKLSAKRQRRSHGSMTRKTGKYLSNEKFNVLNAKYISIGQMLSRMIDRADDFCKHSPATDYRALPRVQETESTSEEWFNVEEFFA